MIYLIDHQDSFTWNVQHQFSNFDDVYCTNYFEINEVKNHYYGKNIKSNYHNQSLKLAKQFK